MMKVKQKIIYTKDGEEKSFWQTLGTAFVDRDSGQVSAMELNSLPIPVRQSDGSMKVRLNIFADEQKKGDVWGDV
tara:strand:+ start:658 stop:882 length:225 start_codon:yes stop_codon:yes gene_type:complete